LPRVLKETDERLWINYHGLFESPMSWAHVNREVVLALDRLGCRVTVMAYRGFGYDPSFPLGERLTALRSGPKGHEWDVVFDYPLNYKRLRASRKAGMLVYETTELPPHWAQAVREHLDLLVVPSSFCVAAAERSGIPPERILRIPYAYNPSLFAPRPKPAYGQVGSGGRFTFLCVAMPHLRKGLRELVQAFREEFAPDEPVQLILKLPYLPSQKRRRRPWELKDVEALLPPGPPGSPDDRKIHIVCRSEPPDKMPLWLAFCDAYVQPSYGEGFGLTILEAKAIGRPTVVTGWGGHMDFCKETNSYLIDYELVPAGEVQYDNGSKSAHCARPIVESLRGQMRRVFQNPEEAREKARRSLRDVRAFTWKSTARQLQEALQTRM
jgi:glycosyltransferase involved in cell wall biosynthesis